MNFQFGFKVQLFSNSLDLSTVADPAAATTLSLDLGSAGSVSVNAAALAGRTLATLVSELTTALAAELPDHSVSSAGNVINFLTIDVKEPTSSAAGVLTVVKQLEFSNAMGYGLSALAGFALGKA